MAKPIKTTSGKTNFSRFLKPELINQVQEPAAKKVVPLKAKEKTPAKPKEVKPAKTAPKKEVRAKAEAKKTEIRRATTSAATVTLADEVADKRRDFSLTTNTYRELEEITSLFRNITGENINRSQILRSLIRVLAKKKPELKVELAKLTELNRPGNARGNEAEMVEFEEVIGEAILEALK